ncbi:MAG: pyridoxal phosphate-dependent aminotransferase [Fimbriimonadaceae bacterium]|nr:MAG: pyridoxal phosphate-dependent aminotransferase [Fimbriimonadaceae bacterium]
MVHPELSQRCHLIKPSPTLAMTARARDMKAAGINVLSFAAGEPDFNTPEEIREAAKVALDEGQTKYCSSRGLPLLIEAIQRKVSRENGFQCNANQVVVSCGAKHSIYNALQVLINPGDEVILFAPFWMTYADQVLLAGGKPVIIHTTAETGFTPDPDQIKRAITAKTKVLIVNTPSNPTGGAWSRQLIKEVASIALKHNLMIISDEIYERLTYDHDHCSFASLSKDVAAHTITILGVSKTYSMTGWRIGFSVSTPEIATAIANFQDQVTSNATTFAQAGAAAALDSATETVAGMKQKFCDRRELGLKLLGDISGLKTAPPKGAFYFFTDVSLYLTGRISTDVDLADHLLDTAHIATIPGSVFYGPGHLRLSYANSPEAITEGFTRLKNALNDLS